MSAKKRIVKARSSKGLQQKLNKNGFAFVVLIVAIFVIVVGFYCINLKHKSDELEARKVALEEQIEEEEKRTKELEELEKYMQTKKYMEDVARKKLGLVYPDEILIQPSNK